MKCLKNSKSLKQLPHLAMVRELEGFELITGVNMFQKSLRII